MKMKGGREKCNKMRMNESKKKERKKERKEKKKEGIEGETER